jgi:hypothetical protein
MKKAAAALLVTALGAGIVSAAADAHALGPLSLELGAKAGVGTNPDSGNPNPLGFGIGGRGGVSIMGLYGGVNVMYYLGSSQTESILGTSESVSVHTLLYGVEGGYGLTLLNLLTLRAQLGIGDAAVTGSGNVSAPGVSGGGSKTNNGLYLEPGVVGMVSLGMWFVGADLNALILTDFNNGSGNSSTKTAMTLHGQLGVTF